MTCRTVQNRFALRSHVIGGLGRRVRLRSSFHIPKTCPFQPCKLFIHREPGWRRNGRLSIAI